MQRHDHGLSSYSHPWEVKDRVVFEQGANALHTAQRRRVAQRRLSMEVAIRVDSQLEKSAQSGIAIFFDGAYEKRHVFAKCLAERYGFAWQRDVTSFAANLELARLQDVPRCHGNTKLFSKLPGARSLHSAATGTGRVTVSRLLLAPRESELNGGAQRRRPPEK